VQRVDPADRSVCLAALLERRLQRAPALAFSPVARALERMSPAGRAHFVEGLQLLVEETRPGAAREEGCIG
jgi:hypothetical protein